MEKSFTTPELDRACDSIIKEHANDSEMTIRVSYFANNKNECWLLSQKNSDAKTENDPEGIVGIILTRNQVGGLIELLQKELERTTPNKE
jgi:hypothetical protein